MIVPDKITPYNDSIISKIPIVIKEVILCEKNLVSLWQEVQNKFIDINEFILTIDVAFALGIIEYLNDKQVINYVKADKV
jgi:hypothetical protein